MNAKRGIDAGLKGEVKYLRRVVESLEADLQFERTRSLRLAEDLLRGRSVKEALKSFYEDGVEV